MIIFAKVPAAGRVKTRLIPFLSAEQAAELYRCMLLDTLEKTKAFTDTACFIFHEPAADAADFFGILGDHLGVRLQRGKDLGERLGNAFREVLSEGYGAVAVIGTDSPSLPSAFVASAFEMLKDTATEAVLGPCTDGGYYLIAMKRLHEAILRDIPWSTSLVLRTSLEAALQAGISVSLLPEWHDVDTADDLARPELLDETNEAPLTRECLRKFAFTHLCTSTL